MARSQSVRHVYKGKWQMRLAGGFAVGLGVDTQGRAHQVAGFRALGLEPFAGFFVHADQHRDFVFG